MQKIIVTSGLTRPVDPGSVFRLGAETRVKPAEKVEICDASGQALNVARVLECEPGSTAAYSLKLVAIA